MLLLRTAWSGKFVSNLRKKCEILQFVARQHTLVSCSWLHDNLPETKTSHGVRVFDVSFVPDKKVDGYEEFYLQGHIPTALYFDLHKNVNSTDLIPRNLPDIPLFEKYMRELAVGSDTHVVTYDRFNNMAAVRLWWLLRLYGHEKTSVLDGGLAKWVNDGYPTSTIEEKPDLDQSEFTVKYNPQLLRDFQSITENIKSQKEQLVDARSSDNFLGQSKPNTGHIPFSKNIPFATLFNKDGTFKTKDELKEMFESADIDLTQPMVATCNSGMTACSLAMAAAIIGRDNVPVYFGSWTEWSNKAPTNLRAIGPK